MVECEICGVTEEEDPDEIFFEDDDGIVCSQCFYDDPEYGFFDDMMDFGGEA